MADTPIINVTDLTPIVASAIVTGQQVTIYDQAGNAYRAPIEDVVSAALTLSSAVQLKYVKLSVAAADMLTSFTTPIPFGLTVPVGFYAQPISVQVGVDFNTTAYATNTGAAVRAVGATTYIAGHATVLAATLSRVANLSINNSASAGQTQYIDGADLEFYTQTGDPTAGDSVVDVYLSYALIEL